MLRQGGQPFDITQDHEFFDVTQDHELVEWPAEWHIERAGG
jgi:hypothetical protein